MSDPLPASHSESCWTAARLKLYSWLAQWDQSLADLYESALDVLLTRPLPSSGSLGSHAVRELMNRLATVITGIAERVDYRKVCDELAKKWVAEQLPVDGSLPVPIGGATAGGALLPNEVFLAAVRVVNMSQAEGAARRKAHAMFVTLDPENEKSPALLNPVVGQWMEVHRIAQGTTHHPKGSNALEAEAVVEALSKLESVLMPFAEGIFATVGELDEILEDTNS